MKYVPLDHIKDNFLFEPNTYGCHEYWHQEKLMTRSVQKVTQKTFKGVPYKILRAVDQFHGHFRTQQGQLPQKTTKVYSDG